MFSLARSIRQILVAAFVLVLWAPASPAHSADKTTSTVPLPPMVGLYYSAEELTATRAMINAQPWRAGMRDYMTAKADEWMALSDDEIRSLLPKPGSLFSYGQNGCPKCKARWKPFGAETCSLDRPGKTICPKCETVFPDPDPASPYHDTGKGVMIDGKRYYLTAVWNAFVVNSMYSAQGPDGTGSSVLALSYALTGNEAYARKAIVMMDALATLQPSTRGPRDFDYDEDQTKDKGRFHLLTSIVHRAQAPMARNIDLVGNHPMMQTDSPTNPGTKIGENIRLGLFEDYLWNNFDVREGRLSTLHNHEADSVRGMIATGLLFGNADYIRWGIASLDALLENTVDRDGMYYETSMGYTIFTRSVFLDMAEMLANYRPEKYAGYPGDFPPARNFMDHPKLQKLIVDNTDMNFTGRRVSLGNSHGDNAIITKPAASFNITQFLEIARLGFYTTDKALKKRTDAMLQAGADPAPPKAPVAPWWWLMKNPNPIPKKTGNPDEFNMFGDGRFFSTKGMAGFQFGDWPDKRGIIVRGGPNLPHAQDDNLGLNLFDLGRELCAELGYGTFDTPLHKGWSTRAVAHCIVTVDGDAAMDGYFKKTPGSNWRSFLNGDVVKYMDADGRLQFDPEKLPVEKFRRRIVTVVVDEANSYYIDLFDVKGGSFRDYSFHAPWNDKLLTAALTMEGIDPKPVKGAWTAAGLSPEFRDASWNAPGRSWGERVGNAETITPVDPPDDAGGYGWMPPGRGYGFLYNLRGAKTAKPWSATWALEGSDDAHLRVGFFPTNEMGAYAANAPDLLGAHLYNFILARDEGSSESRFLTVIEPYRKQRTVRRIEVLRNDKRGPVALKIELTNGATDLLLLGENAGTEEVLKVSNKKSVSAAAEMAFVRFDSNGDPVHASMMRGRKLAVDGVELLKTPATPSTNVASVDLAKGTFKTGKVDLPGKVSKPDATDGELAGSPGWLLEKTHIQGGIAKTFCPEVVLSGEGYPVDVTMEIDGSESGGNITLSKDGTITVDAKSVALQQFRVDTVSDDGLTSLTIPLPLAYVHSKSTHALDGHHIADSEGKLVGRITATPHILAIRTTPETLLEKDKLYWVMDFVEGHRVDFPLAATWDLFGQAGNDGP
ncbi:hypothetical protein CVU37_07465 [candidate division BRC1 bacterium HGW-BRC1-1]|nr:MAG: hypothetical protein CVU37_07465 [candidate division BRC1 bacterium HGW-BRC1-1]